MTRAALALLIMAGMFGQVFVIPAMLCLAANIWPAAMAIGRDRTAGAMAETGLALGGVAIFLAVGTADAGHIITALFDHLAAVLSQGAR
jgi:hypothetical protein